MKIQKIKKTGKKYKIILDNTELTTFDDVIINNNLLYKKEIDLDTLNKINNETNYYEYYYKTLNYITKKLRSKKEVINYLDKLEANNKDKEKIITKLEEIGMINDNIFTKAYIQDGINLSNKGPYKIKKELLSYDILEDVIDSELNKLDDSIIVKKLEKLINKKTKNTKYTGYILKQKIVNDLINLGYSKESILEIYDSINIDKSDLLKKEYNKLYKKLGTKYSGKELDNKIRIKLYQKGFNVEQINSISEID